MFDLNKFERAAFEPRQGDVALPVLAEFFKAGAEPVFIVRGLTASELAIADESAKKGKLIGEMVEKLLETTSSKDKAQAILESAGISNAKDVPQIVKTRIEHVRLGCVSPALSLAHVVKLADCFPIEFSRLANTVLELTGQGRAAVVKPLPSGSAATSEQP